MSTPTHTPLRHRILREVSTDRDFTYDQFSGRHGQFDHKGGRLPANELRALHDLDRLGLLTAPKGCVELSDDGRSLLAEWDAAHPDSKDGGDPR